MIKRPSLNGSRLQSVRWRKQTVGGYFKLWQDFADICWIVRIFRELCQYRAKYSASPAQYCHRLILQNSTPVFFKMHGGDNLDHYEPDSVKLNSHNLDWFEYDLKNILCSLNLLKSCVTKPAEFSYSDSQKSSLFQVCKNLVYSGFQKSCTSILIF